jgi:putative ABC transport system permease protein
VVRQPPLPLPPEALARRPSGTTGISYGFLTITARVDSRSRAGDLYQTVRSVDQRNILKVEFVDDQYARQFEDRLLATRIITAFGVLTFLVATAGIYALMTFLVTSRAREIGIRIALGADRQRIRQLVFGSSMWLVLLGVVLGTGGALAASRWTQSQLFGVRASDPLTIGLVAIGVALTALVATWQPANQATRIDPRILLKN